MVVQAPRISTTGMFRASTAGDYTVQARRAGHTGRSKAKVNGAAATLTAVKIAPDVVTLQPGATFTFGVSGTMSDGTTVPVTGTWTATGGTMTSSGVYTAGGTAGQFRVIVTQQGGTFADTATVTISAAAPTLQAVEVTPATVSLTSGAGAAVQRRRSHDRQLDSQRHRDLDRDRRLGHERGSVYGWRHGGHLPRHRDSAGRHQGRYLDGHHHACGADAHAR